MKMKDFMKSTLVFAAAFVFVLTFRAGARSQDVLSEAPSSPVEAGARMEIEIDGVKTAFRWCPPGSFTRRWDKSTESWWEKQTERDGESRDFKIMLTQGFWLAETETTQELWQAVTGENPSEGHRARKAPVNYVSRWDALTFISKLNDWGYAPAGFEFRLPTEAQWEYACLAGSSGERYGELDAIAWHIGNSEGRAHEVGQRKANAWGLYDMLGNVWERCWDMYGQYPMKDLTDYAGPADGSGAVFRGGGWGSAAGRCVRSCRVIDSLNGADWSDNLGFRLAIVPKEE